MEQILLLAKHMMSYLTCAIFLMKLCCSQGKHLATYLKLALVSLLAAMVTTAAGKIFSVPFISILMVILLGLYFHILGRGKLLTVILLALDVYTLTLFLNMVLGSAAYAVMRLLFHSGNALLTAASNLVLFAAAVGLMFFFLPKRKIRDKELEGSGFYSVSSLCIFVLLCILAVTLPNYLSQTQVEWFFALNALVMVAVILIAIGENRREKRKVDKLMKDIRDLSSQIHHNKEYLPAVRRRIETEFERLNSQTNAAEIAQELAPMKEEVDRLYAEQMKEGRREFLCALTPVKTGIMLLDGLLDDFHSRMAAENILFRVNVYDSPAILLKENQIPQNKLLELIGDVLANAINAIKRKETPLEDGETVELSMGVSEYDYYEIEVYDSGEPFPEEILREFGRRGLTTGGTGQGIANMLETLRTYHIALSITEFSEEEEFAKCMDFCFGEEFEISFRGERSGIFRLYSEE